MWAIDRATLRRSASRRVGRSDVSSTKADGSAVGDQGDDSENAPVDGCDVVAFVLRQPGIRNIEDDHGLLLERSLAFRVVRESIRRAYGVASLRRVVAEGEHFARRRIPVADAALVDLRREREMAGHQVARGGSIDRPGDVAGHRNEAIELAGGSPGTTAEPGRADQTGRCYERQADLRPWFGDQGEHGQTQPRTAAAAEGTMSGR
jgi:hypothetical protein